LSVCSGIEAATVAWHPLDWEPAAFAEIDPFACELLHFRYGCGRPMFMPDPADPDIGAKDRRARAAAIKAVARLPEHPNPGCPPNLGDLTRFKEWPDLAIDLLVGGTPCQSFSVAGLRAGLVDPRGNLALTYLAIADRYKPRWLAWENVPGVLSSNGGLDFGAILGGMVELRYGIAYRVLDAQFVRTLGFAGAVPQRRRRVLVIGYTGDWRRAAAVLFDGASLRGDSAPRREAGQIAAQTLDAGAGRRRGSGMNPNQMVPEVSGTLEAGANSSGGNRPPGSSQQGAADMLIPIGGGPDGGQISGTVSSKWAKGSGGPAGDELYNTVAVPTKGGAAPAIAFHHQMGAKAGGIGAGEEVSITVGTKVGGGAVAFDHIAAGNTGLAIGDDVAGALRVAGHAGSHQSIAYNITPSNSNKHYRANEAEHAQAVTEHARGAPSARGGTVVATAWRVRRLTPSECERLQGFPDGYTQIPRGNKPTADGPRYKALGNSMAVNVMRVLGQRLELVDRM
jgi:DNA (cytosine-5)-methyltransferase 1